jgi:dephospho-CoA kinase
MEGKRRIIAIVGMPGAGKSVAAQFFHNKNIPILRFGDQTDIGLAELGLTRSEVNERMYREKIRAELGMAAMAIKIEPRINSVPEKEKLVVLDGLYSWEEYLYLSDKFPHLELLCIYASPKVRYQRLENRPVRPLTPSDARSRDIAELENLNKGGPIALSDHLILNEGTPDQFNELLEKLWKDLV